MSDYREIARCIIDAAEANGYLSGGFAVNELLAQYEHDLFISIAAKTRELIDSRDERQLYLPEMHSMFLFVYAEAAAVLSAMHGGRQVSGSDFSSLFSGRIALEVEENLLELVKETPLADQLYEAFMDWVEDNPDFCERNKIDPLLPLLEALKWTFRVSCTFVAAYFN